MENSQKFSGQISLKNERQETTDFVAIFWAYCISLESISFAVIW